MCARKFAAAHVSNQADPKIKAHIENAPVLGDAAGEATLNVCTKVAASHVSNPAAPKIKVCGTGIKHYL